MRTDYIPFQILDSEWRNCLLITTYLFYMFWSIGRCKVNHVNTCDYIMNGINAMHVMDYCNTLLWKQTYFLSSKRNNQTTEFAIIIWPYIIYLRVLGSTSLYLKVTVESNKQFCPGCTFKVFPETSLLYAKVDWLTAYCCLRNWFFKYWSFRLYKNSLHLLLYLAVILTIPG